MHVDQFERVCGASIKQVGSCVADWFVTEFASHSQNLLAAIPLAQANFDKGLKLVFFNQLVDHAISSWFAHESELVVSEG